MALFDTTDPISQSARDPRYGDGNIFFKRSGQLTGLGKGVSVVVPGITRVAGSVIGAVTGIPGLGEAIGSLGTVATEQVLRNSSQDLTKYRDSANGVAQALGEGTARAELGNAAGGVVGSLLENVDLSGLAGGNSATTPKQKPIMAAPTVIPDLPAMQYTVPVPTVPLPAWQDNSIFSATTPTRPNQSPFYRYFAGGHVTKEGGYTIYPDDDKVSEDLVMIDKKTGQQHGASRYGEYLVSQNNTLKAGEVMAGKGSYQHKVLELGKILYEQLDKKPVDVPVDYYVEGGPILPKKVIDQFRQHNQQLIDNWQSVASRNVITGAQQNRKAEAQKIIDGAKQNLAALDRGEINYDAGRDALINKSSGQVFSLKTLRQRGAYDNNSGFHTQQQYRIGSEDSFAGNIPIGTPSAATPPPIQIPGIVSYPKTPQSQGVGQSANRAGVPTTAALTNSIVQPQTVASGQTTPVVPQNNPNPGKTGRGGKKATAPVVTAPATPGRLNLNIPAIPSLATNERAAGIVENQLDPYGRKVAALNAQIEAIGKDLTDQNGQTDKKPGIDLTNLAGNVTDIGRLAAGVSLASKPIESPSIPQQWMSYMGELSQRKNQGLTPEEMALGSNLIANNFRQGVSALTNTTGGGASPGVVLAGLSNLGLQRGMQTQNLLVTDALRRGDNFNRYGAGVAQTTAMEQGIQADRIARQTQDRGVGIGLIGAALQNMEQRNIASQNDDLWNKVMQAQVNRENEATQTLKGLRDYYATRAAI